jgi:hypothetical protein
MKTKRGRPPIGRKAMTDAQRQARRRAKLKQIALERKQRRYQPPPGYGAAKRQLRVGGHQFEWARRDRGFEEGVFVDGAFLGSRQVIELAGPPPQERDPWLAEQRQATKSDACGAVVGYMQGLHVTLDELIAYRARNLLLFR